ncbi:hypothetical protein [Saliniramus sp.]|uniref:hypothetical protein n=1 Tax=Saliniramus sp. TaxID=2986772 RepID=UPI002CDFB8F5|nr:hypothetical protein [Saliniramus sp.]HMB09591.1 hypothetical protein [Saliniramus sp.]
MKSIDADLREIEDFIDNLQFSSKDIRNQKIRPAFKSAYKQFKAVLIWNSFLQRKADIDDELKLFIRECTSDLSHSFYLFVLNFYKPARVLARSSIENFLRATLIHKSVNVFEIKSVFELFSSSKNMFCQDQDFLRLTAEIESLYASLCKTVHSTKFDYMSQVTSFENFSKFKISYANSDISTLRKLSSSINKSLFIIFRYNINEMNYKNSDIILDSIPRSMKRKSMLLGE